MGEIYINLTNSEVAVAEAAAVGAKVSVAAASARDIPVTAVPGVGDKKAAHLRTLGITTLYDAVTYYPKTFTDYTNPRTLREIEPNATGAVAAVIGKKMRPHLTATYSLYRLIAADRSGDELVIVFWQTPYWYQMLEVGTEYIFYGKVGGDGLRREMSQPSFVRADDPLKLLPRYRLTAGLSNAVLTAVIKSALTLYREMYTNAEDPLYGIAARFGLTDKLTAVTDAHFPRSDTDYASARRRIAFEELLTLQLGLGILKQNTAGAVGVAMSEKFRMVAERFLCGLPFTPTGAQVRSAFECLSDLVSEVPMNRLLQGDVGSGKTAVAAAACAFVAANGAQSCLMAPTEILAKQHYNTFRDFFGKKYNIALLTGSLTPKEKAEVKKLIKSGGVDIVIGTHALVQKSVVFNNLAFVIVDEQHRFGVKQRETLMDKGGEVVPHTLIMSATPIPRTLALFMYADLAVSVLDEMPPGRKPVSTYSVGSDYLQRLHKFILGQAASGYKSYVVCPLIDDSDTAAELDSGAGGTGGTGGANAGGDKRRKLPAYAEKASAMRIKDELARELVGLNVALLHGKMRQSEKDAVMRDFKYGDTDVLVSTTVVEVGVDVPAATVMLILNAEQFGLSALHQLRGRVGRGDAQSYCVLVTDSKSEYTAARMKIMTETTDGFKIANEDLRLRGPGDFFGDEQHGLPKMKFSAMPRLDEVTDDITVMEQTKAFADEILTADPTLTNAASGCWRELLARSGIPDFITT